MAFVKEPTAAERPRLPFAHVDGVRIAYEVTGDSDWGVLRGPRCRLRTEPADPGV